MKPSENAVEILILADPEYPDGIYAWVDYDTDNKEYDRLKWVCDNEFWFKFLTVTLIHMAPEWGLNHYGCDHPNPPLEAAKIAAERFKIKILSEGITRKTGIPEDSLDPEFGYELPK